MKRWGWALLGMLWAVAGWAASEVHPPPVVWVPSFREAAEAARIIAATRAVPVARRVALVSQFFLGRKYHPETKARMKKEAARPRTKAEAVNPRPLPVETLPTSLQYLDCMTYVEHVLALASADRPDYAGAFLPRLVDIMYDAAGAPLMNHLRSHFTSAWGDVLERKGYLRNVARGHPAAVKREVVLNRVGANRTFYVEDRFTIAAGPQVMWYFPLAAVFARKAPLANGDVLALACEKEGLDVVHMGFFIEQKGKRLLRHASSKLNRIIEEDLDGYLRNRKGVVGLMVWRPRLAAPTPPRYRFAPRGR